MSFVRSISSRYSILVFVYLSLSLALLVTMRRRRSTALNNSAANSANFPIGRRVSALSIGRWVERRVDAVKDTNTAADRDTYRQKETVGERERERETNE